MLPKLWETPPLSFFPRTENILTPILYSNMEETTLFPEIEKKTGEEGIMDVNVEQHRE